MTLREKKKKKEKKGLTNCASLPLVATVLQLTLPHPWQDASRNSNGRHVRRASGNRLPTMLPMPDLRECR